MRRSRRVAVVVSATAALACAASCGSDESDAGTQPGSSADAPRTLTLVAYDSFAMPEEAFASFTARTGITVEVATAGDAGQMVSKAVLSAGNPEGDVMFGVDNTLLSRALDADVFEPHRAAGLDAVPAELTALAPGHEVTPIDLGDVCVNYDIAWLRERGHQLPETLDDLTRAEYRDLLVVENPATSSPGLAFLLATVAAYGDGWTDYWATLRDNGVKVVDSWDQAYGTEFSGSSGRGSRPLVVSYASSPPFEVIYADPPRTDAPTGVATGTCFRQVEFAGVLRGTEHPQEAGELIDHMLSTEFQSLLPLNLFVYPARDDVELPAEFVQYTAIPDEPYTVAPADIDAHRAEWIDEWTSIVLR